MRTGAMVWKVVYDVPVGPLKSPPRIPRPANCEPRWRSASANAKNVGSFEKEKHSAFCCLLDDD